jgi:glycosyltransferase involved in cell wall biosynthesis
MAAEAARYLPENYHLHIIGFGNEADVKAMQDRIRELEQSSKCAISYDGCLRGEEYIQFLQKCQVGLSTQNPNAAFNDTSFPSKILSYMANGLQVVTVRIPVVEEAAIGQWMHYYDEPTPQAVADAILSVQTSDARESRQIISRLDQEFVKNINKLLED